MKTKAYTFFQSSLIFHQLFIIAALIALSVNNNQESILLLYGLIAASALLHLSYHYWHHETARVAQPSDIPDRANEKGQTKERDESDSRNKFNAINYTNKEYSPKIIPYQSRLDELLTQLEVAYEGGMDNSRELILDSFRRLLAHEPNEIKKNDIKNESKKNIHSLKSDLIKKESQLQELRLNLSNCKEENAKIILTSQTVIKELAEIRSLINSSDSYILVENLLEYTRKYNLEYASDTINKIRQSAQYGDAFVRSIDDLLKESPQLATCLDPSEDKYDVMIKAYQRAYRYLIQTFSWWVGRKKKGDVSNFQIDIEIAQIIKSIFDAIWLKDNKHWNYKILEGESFSTLRDSAQRQNASNYDTQYDEYILFCQNKKVEFEVFMTQDILCPIWIELNPSNLTNNKML